MSLLSKVASFFTARPASRRPPVPYDEFKAAADTVTASAKSINETLKKTPKTDPFGELVRDMQGQGRKKRKHRT